MTKIYAIAMALVLLATSATAQVFPYLESFESLRQFTALNGQGGLAASNHVQVYPRGIEQPSGKCAEVQNFTINSRRTDTIISPLIGPLTANSQSSFYFRAVQYVGGQPLSYNMTANDKVEIYIYSPSFGISSLQYTINASNQNVGTSWKQVLVNAPGIVNGQSGNFKIIVYNGVGNSNDWVFHLDSLRVRDTLSNLPAISINTDSTFNIKCKGDSTGRIYISTSGTTRPTFAWSTGNASDRYPYLTGKRAGTYSVTVTDSTGVTKSQSFTLNEPALALSIQSFSQTNVKCNGDKTGTATIAISGGTSPYGYSWNISPVQTSSTVTALPKGNYTVSASDNNGCVVTATAVISQPAAKVSATLSATTSSGNNGTATVTPTGGVKPYTVQWRVSGNDQAFNTITGLAPGTYAVVVSDSNGCSYTDSIKVKSSLSIQDLNLATIKLYPQPATDVVNIVLDQPLESVAVLTITDLRGSIIRSENMTSNSFKTDTLAAGMYLVVLTNRGVRYSQKLLIK